MTSYISTKKCLECGVEFGKKSSESKKYWTAKKYCSQACSLKNTAVQEQDFDRSFLKDLIPWNKGIKGIHLSPKTEFKKNHLVNLGRIRLDMRGENNPKWVEKIKRKCAFCKKKLFLAPNQVRNRTRSFCSRECWSLGTRDTGSPVYKGENAVSRFRGRIACMPEYRAWHAAVLKRDGYKCVLCKCVHSKDRPLEVDHIKRFLFIANEYEIRTQEDARKCPELWDIKNGQTVCRVCHRTLDTYGTKGLTRH